MDHDFYGPMGRSDFGGPMGHVDFGGELSGKLPDSIVVL